MKTSRVSLAASAPELYRIVASLERKSSEHIAAAGIALGFSHLLRLRASQLNGCAFCLRMHAHEALAAGEPQARLNVLPAWRETGYYTEKERAALALIEAVTLIADGQVPDPIYDQAARLLSPEEISAVEWLGVVINIWNRIAIPSRTEVGPDTESGVGLGPAEA